MLQKQTSRQGSKPLKTHVMSRDVDMRTCVILFLIDRLFQKQTSRQGSKPLKTHVMHTSVVAFQQLAVRCMSWLQELTTKTEALRKLFCNVILERPPPPVLSLALSSVSSSPPGGVVVVEASIVERLLLADTKLWKGQFGGRRGFG